MKEFIIKNIDIFTEELRFIHNLMLALLSGLAGIFFALISKKLTLDLGVIMLITMGILILVILVILKNNINIEQQKLLDKLKDLEC